MTTTHNGKPYMPKATPKAACSLRKDYAVPTRSAVHHIRFWTSSRPVLQLLMEGDALEKTFYSPSPSACAPPMA